MLSVVADHVMCACVIRLGDQLSAIEMLGDPASHRFAHTAALALDCPTYSDSAFGVHWTMPTLPLADWCYVLLSWA